MEAPIFSSPVVDGVTSTVIVAAVNGKLQAFSHLGETIWLCNLAAQVYAPLCFIPAQMVEQCTDPARSRDTSRPHSEDVDAVTAEVNRQPNTSGLGPLHDSSRLTDKELSSITTPAVSTEAQTSRLRQRRVLGAVVVIGDTKGHLHSLNAASGVELSMHSMQSAISTAATCFTLNASHPQHAKEDQGIMSLGSFAHEHSQMSEYSDQSCQQLKPSPATSAMQDSSQLAPATPDGKCSHIAPLVASCTNDGVMSLLKFGALTRMSDDAVVCAVRLPGRVSIAATL